MNELTRKGLSVFGALVCLSLCGCKGAADQSTTQPAPQQQSAKNGKTVPPPGDSMITPAGKKFQERIGTALKDRG